MADDRSRPADAPEAGDPAETVRDFREYYRRTWELELLISAGVLFALFQVPELIDAGYRELSVHASEAQDKFLFFGYYYLKLITYVLIVTFFANLAARAYWVGLIGLNSVFPHGVRWDRHKMGPVGMRVQREQPTLPELIVGADRVCSTIFSASFFVIMILVISVIYLPILGAVAWWLSKRAWLGGDFGKILPALMLLVLSLPPLVCTILDRVFAGKLENEWKDGRLARAIRRVLLFYQYLFLGPLHTHILLTLSTNVKKRWTVPLSMALFFGLIGFFLLNEVAGRSPAPPLHGYRYFTEYSDELGVKPRHYESLREAGGKDRFSPRIQSDVVSGPFVKLFLPYSPEEHNEPLASLCAEVEEVPLWHLLRKDRARRRPAPEAVEAALNCLATLHRVSLDGEPVAPEYSFYTHPETGERGLVTYLPTAGLPQGRNLLRVVEARPADDAPGDGAPGGGDGEDGDGEDGDRPAEHFIPFWVGG